MLAAWKLKSSVCSSIDMFEHVSAYLCCSCNILKLRAYPSTCQEPSLLLPFGIRFLFFVFTIPPPNSSIVLCCLYKNWNDLKKSVCWPTEHNSAFTTPAWLDKENSKFLNWWKFFNVITITFNPSSKNNMLENSWIIIEGLPIDSIQAHTLMVFHLVTNQLK